MPSRYRLPFDWKNPFGYFGAILLQYTIYVYASTSLMIIISIVISSYLFEMSLTNDLKDILQLIDRNSKIKKTRKNLYAQFTEFIDFHSDTKQLS